MQYREQVFVFACEGEQLLGIVCGPDDSAVSSGVGVVIVVGGPQYRAGSHRQFVLLSRTLAAKGHHCLRFDYRGMGDSTGPTRDFENVSHDVDAAVSALHARCPGLRKIVLWGLCDGASASLLYLLVNGAPAQVGGLCLVNPWVRSNSSLARAQVKHYYTRRLLQKAFWQKLARGETGLRALREFGEKLRQTVHRSPSAHNPQSSYQQRMAAAWRAFAGPVLLLLSGDDLVAREFLDHAQTDQEWRGLLDMPRVQRQDLHDADHTFSTSVWRNRVEDLTARWLGELSRDIAAPGGTLGS